MCEPPNAGATTPVHPQTKQSVDDIDPDIIPNEYGESTAFRLFEMLGRITVYLRARTDAILVRADWQRDLFIGEKVILRVERNEKNK